MLCPTFVCLFVCWVNKTRAVKPLRRFHSWILSFTQDGPAFSTKTARRALQFQLRSALSTSWRAVSPFKINNPCWSHWTRQAPHQTHPKPPIFVWLNKTDRIYTGLKVGQSICARAYLNYFLLISQQQLPVPTFIFVHAIFWRLSQVLVLLS